MSQVYRMPVPMLADESSTSQVHPCLPFGRTYALIIAEGENPPQLGPWWVRPPRWATRVDVSVGYYDTTIDAQVNDRSTPGALVGYLDGGYVGIYTVPSNAGPTLQNVLLLGGNLAGHAMQAGPVSLPVLPQYDLIVLPTGLTGLAPGSELSWSFRWWP